MREIGSQVTPCIYIPIYVLCCRGGIAINLIALQSKDIWRISEIQTP